jgi:hypothetical protein
MPALELAPNTSMSLTIKSLPSHEKYIVMGGRLAWHVRVCRRSPSRFPWLIRFCDSVMSLKICGFAICGVIITKLRACNLRTDTPYKFAVCDNVMSLKTCGFAICGQKKKFVCPPLALSLFLYISICSKHVQCILPTVQCTYECTYVVCNIVKHIHNKAGFNALNISLGRQ